MEENQGQVMIQITTTTTTSQSIQDIQNQIDFVDREIATLQDKKAALMALISI